MSSPSEKTLKHYRDKGYTVGIVERFLKFAGPFGKRKDLFGFIDIIAMNGQHILGIQSCGTSFSAHHKKIMDDPELHDLLILWLKSCGSFELIGWRKVLKKKGGKLMIYKPRVRRYFYDCVVMCVGWVDKNS